MKSKAFILGQLATNCYLVWDEETKDAILIDPGEINPRIESAIETERLSLGTIVLTHTHFDHTGGVKYYAEKYGAQIAAHRLDADGLTDIKKSLSYAAGITETQKRADILLEDGDEINFGNVTGKVIHTPGHTVGGISLLFDNVLYSGDTLFFRSIGRTDFPGGSFEQIEKSITEKLYVLDDDTKVYPGHGSKTTIGYEKQNNPYVRG